MEKIALLDTDFTVKTIMSQKDDGIHLMELFVSVSGFCLACHEQTVAEIGNHDYNGSYKWIKEQIDDGKIKEYSDNEIIGILEGLYGSSACLMYRQLLKKSCDAQKPMFYQEFYSSLDSFSYPTDKDAFLDKLKECDDNIGRGQGLGEKKLLVLLQVLQTINPQNVYVFCSDDGGARNSIFSVAKTPCITVISLFYYLKGWGISKEEAEPYYIAYEKTLSSSQTTFKVFNISGTVLEKLPCRQVFNMIYENQCEALGTGFLKAL